MSILDDELARLIALAGPRHRDGTTRDGDGEIEQPITDEAVTAAGLIARAIPFVDGDRQDYDHHWSRIGYRAEAGYLELDLSIDAEAEVDFDFDRGQGPTRRMLSLVATRRGGIIYSILTRAHKSHGTVSAEGARSRLAELFHQFTDG